MGIALSDKQRALLEYVEYPFYEYDLLGILKGAFVGKIYHPGRSPGRYRAEDR